MGKNKLQRFEENKTRANLIEIGKPLYETIKGNWNKLYFQNDHPIVVELACGNGEYSIGLAEKNPNKNFVGIDLKGDRLWKGSKICLEKNLTNVAFLRCNIIHLENFFAAQEIAELWIIHPDPHPRRKEEKHRLTNPNFLTIYKKILAPGGWVRLKTDSTSLFDYTLKILEKFPICDLHFTADLYNSPFLAEHEGIVTKYEKMFTEKGEKIKYIKFRFFP